MFVKLTEPTTNTTMCLKTSKIEAIFKNNLGNTRVDTKNGKYVYNKTPEEVYKKISAC